jgi:hypothetical protein
MILTIGIYSGANCEDGLRHLNLSQGDRDL